MSSCGKNESPQEMNRRKFLKVFGGWGCRLFGGALRLRSQE